MKLRELALGVLGFAAAVAFVPGFVDPGGAPRWAVLAVGVPCCLFIVGHRDVPWWCFTWLPAAALTVAWAPDRLHALDELARLTILAASFYLGACARDLGPLWRGLAAGVAISAAIAAAQLMGWDGLPQAAPPAGLFVNRNLLAEAALVALIASPLPVLTAIAAAAIVMTSSKAVYGALLAAIAALLMRGRSRVAWTIVALLAACTIALYALGSASLEARFVIWQPAWTYLSLFGRGLGAFAVDFPMALHVHCEPLQLVYELGILAVPFFAVVIYALGAPQGEMSDGTQVERLLLVAFAAVALFAFPLHAPLSAFAAAVAAGHLCGARHRIRVRDDAWAIPARFCP